MPPEDRHSGTPGGGGGADVKSGVIPPSGFVSDGDSGTVTFTTPFSSAPTVTLTLRRDAQSFDDFAHLTSAPSTTEFDWRLYKGHGGTAHTWRIYWIATDAGDP